MLLGVALPVQHRAEHQKCHEDAHEHREHHVHTTDNRQVGDVGVETGLGRMGDQIPDKQHDRERAENVGAQHRRSVQRPRSAPQPFQCLKQSTHAQYSIVPADMRPAVPTY